MKKETLIKPVSGYPMVLVEFVILATGLCGLIALKNPLALIIILIFLFLLIGFFIIYPNHSKVMALFGDYKGTVKENGFFWINPFSKYKSISLRARKFDSERVKVNDKVGNPILIRSFLIGGFRRLIRPPGK